MSCLLAHGVTMLDKLHVQGSRYSLIVCIRNASVPKLTQSRHIVSVAGFWISEGRRRHALYCHHDKHFGFVLKREGRHVSQGSWRHDNVAMLSEGAPSSASQLAAPGPSSPGLGPQDPGPGPDPSILLTRMTSFQHPDLPNTPANFAGAFA